MDVSFTRISRYYCCDTDKKDSYGSGEKLHVEIGMAIAVFQTSYGIPYPLVGLCYSGKMNSNGSDAGRQSKVWHLVRRN